MGTGQRLFVAAAAILAVSGAWAGPGVKGAPPRRHVTVYFFHRAVRCTSCRTMEEWGRRAVVLAFPSEMRARALVWRQLDLDAGSNLHYKHDFQLRTSSLVLVETVDGKRTRWDRLDGAWDLLKSQPAFSTYVTASIRAFTSAQGTMTR